MVVRHGTRQILERDAGVDVVGEAGDGSRAVELVDELLPDVVLMDVGLPGVGGVEATREITTRHPDVRVIALTVHDDEEYVVEMLGAGAVGYLLKDIRDAELVDAVHRAAEG